MVAPTNAIKIVSFEKSLAEEFSKPFLVINCSDLYNDKSLQAVEPIQGISPPQYSFFTLKGVPPL